MGWLGGTVRRGFALLGFFLMVGGLVTFATTGGLPWAWLTIAALLLLVVSLAWTARDEYGRRVGLEGVAERDAELERAIENGHALSRMEHPVELAEEWRRWHDETYEWLRGDWGLGVAQGFAAIAHQQRGLGGRIAAQTTYLETLRKGR